MQLIEKDILGGVGEGVVGEWNSEYEGRFRKRMYATSMPRMRFVALVTGILYMVAGYADYLTLGPGEALNILLAVRLGAMLLGVATALSLKLMNEGDSKGADILCLYMFVVMFGETVELVLKADLTMYSGIPATTFIILCYYLFQPPGFWVAFVPAVSGSFLYMLGLVAATPAPADYIWVTMLTFALANGFGAYFLSRNERMRRREFQIMMRLMQLAETDVLTGALNRRRSLELGGREFVRARRYEEDLSALMLDLDHFKNVNDTHGHEAGDEVLSSFAMRCRAELRKVDIFGRLGGEEFMVLLPHCDLEQAAVVADRIREGVSRKAFGKGYMALRVTVSVGVAAMESGDADLAALLRRADKALYAAKEGGRDRIAVDGGAEAGVVVEDSSLPS